jgi:hypothetical protein
MRHHNIFYTVIDAEYEKIDKKTGNLNPEYQINVMSSLPPSGGIFISDTKTNGFDLKMMGRLFHPRTNFTVIKGTRNAKI